MGSARDLVETLARRQGLLRKVPASWLAMTWAESIRAELWVLPRSTLGKAVRYLVNVYTALVGYLRDGRFAKTTRSPRRLENGAGSSLGIRMRDASWPESKLVLRAKLLLNGWWRRAASEDRVLGGDRLQLEW